jgi:hypothetical protein
MAIQDYEGNPFRGQPVELYEFVYGTEPGQVYRYTNADEEIVWNGELYATTPIDRDKIETKGRGESEEVTVQVPLYAEIAELFRVFPPGRVVHVTIRQGHLPNPDDPAEFLTGLNFPVVWVGRVLESRRDGANADLTCDNSHAGMKRTGLRLHFQYPCPLALYSARCGADKEAARRATTATVSGVQMTFADGWNGAADPSSYIGGLVEWDGPEGREYRAIYRVVDPTTVVVNAAPRNFIDGSAVDVYLGCPHTLGGCQVLHNNAVNYGGFHRIPTLNPVGKNNHS